MNFYICNIGRQILCTLQSHIKISHIRAILPTPGKLEKLRYSRKFPQCVFKEQLISAFLMGSGVEPHQTNISSQFDFDW